MSVFPLFFRLAVRVRRPRSPSQDHRLRLSALALGALLCLLSNTGRAADPAPADASLGGSLTLTEAERLALSRYPTLAQSAAEIEAARARAVYAGQLQDPQLRLGVEAVPIDSFALNRESMTQVVVGVTQMFPPTGRLALNRRSAEQATAAARARREDLAAQIRRDVRRAWLELFYQERALATLRVNRELYDQVVRAALAQYRTGRAQEADVLKAQLERDELLDQEQTLLAERDAARSRLARLLSLPETALTLPEALPLLPPSPPGKPCSRRWRSIRRRRPWKPRSAPASWTWRRPSATTTPNSAWKRATATAPRARTAESCRTWYPPGW